MISHIVGTIRSLESATLMITPRGSGVSYDIFVSPLAAGAISHAGVGNEGEVWIYHHITDVGQSLFGFGSLEEKKIFLTLLKVSGIGAKTALSLLSLGVDGIIQAIESGDDKTLSSVPGLGKKGALKIILELKGSLNTDLLTPKGISAAPKPPKYSNRDEARDALLGLGYTRSDLDRILSAIDPSLPSDEMIRLSIRELSIRSV